MHTSSPTPANTSCSRPRLGHSLLSCAAGAALVGAVVGAAAFTAASPQQGGDTQYRGLPRDDAQPGSDITFKGPPPQQGAAPAGTGYDNPGGMVDGAALQAAAAQGGIHYHFHYHGTPAQGVTPGYAPAQYVNPESVPAGGMAGYYMPGYGPGNPGPMGSEAGLDANPAVGAQTYTGFNAYGAYGTPGIAGSFSGGGGFFPGSMAINAAYSSAGFVDGFYD